MLGPLAGVTIVATDLDRSVAAYRDYLGYQGDIGTVSDEVAHRWGAPRVAGARMAVLRPAGGETTFIRLVECAVPADYQPLTTFGWNAAELIVRDVDALAERLAGSPFGIIGPPRTLDFDFTDKIRAMQAVGPSGEVLYLTEVGGEVPGFDLPTPIGEVGQVFVAVLGGPSLELLADGLRQQFGVEAGPPFEARVEVLSHAHGLPETTRHPMTTIALPQRTLIELDAFPSTARDRPICACGLPVGIAMATFGNGGGEVVRGPTGAWFELENQQK